MHIIFRINYSKGQKKNLSEYCSLAVVWYLCVLMMKWTPCKFLHIWQLDILFVRTLLVFILVSLEYVYVNSIFVLKLPDLLWYNLWCITSWILLPCDLETIYMNHSIMYCAALSIFYMTLYQPFHCTDVLNCLRIINHSIVDSTKFRYCYPFITYFDMWMVVLIFF